MVRSAVKYAVILACTSPMLLCSGCFMKLTENQVGYDVFLVNNAPRLQSLPQAEPVTIYLGGSVFADQDIAAPVKREVPPASLILVAEIKVRGPWYFDDDKDRYKSYLDIEHPHPLVAKLAVERARKAARHLGCNSLFVKKSRIIKAVVEYETGLFSRECKTFEITFVGGSTR